MDRPTFEQTIPPMLRQAREDRGMTQSDLAKLCSFKPSHISHFEAGRRTPDLYSFFKLAAALGISTKKITSSLK